MSVVGRDGSSHHQVMPTPDVISTITSASTTASTTATTATTATTGSTRISLSGKCEGCVYFVLSYSPSSLSIVL